LTIACHPCNQKKGNQEIKQFLAKKPDLLASILSGAKKPLADAAAVNSTRCSLFEN
jgi:5-methylcytosine-specific restriction endonuclease McrA